ncbi:MAG: glycosyltransferase [Planctomycetota bacterium]|nr:glycosyltransferase [Planctomycetota bacterium]
MREILAKPLEIAIVTPAPRGSRGGNRATALRWAGLLRQLGHRPRLCQEWRDQPCDVLITVHAVKTAAAVRAARRARPALPILTLLSGTDIYGDGGPSDEALATLTDADRIITLQHLARATLPPEMWPRTRTMVQSATAVASPRDESFTACVLAHLRPVKAPLIAVRALASLGDDTPLTLTLAGERLDEGYSDEVKQAIESEPRAVFLGPQTRRESKALLARSTVCVVPSLAEGGANVVSEAIAAGTPVLCSAVPGNLGLLGERWPGAFAAGDVAACAAALRRAATDRPFLDDLRARTRSLQPMVAPATERAAWRALLREVAP